MPWTMENPPRPAKRWSRARKKRCVAAANATLARGGSDGEAIRACIGAAKTKQIENGVRAINDRQEQVYDDLQAEMTNLFVALILAVRSGELSVADFKQEMRDVLEGYYGELAALGKEGDVYQDGETELTEQDKAALEAQLGVTYLALDGLVDDLESADTADDMGSEAYLAWRAGLYALAWGVLTWFSLPWEITVLLPTMPGSDCLGNGACHCTWVLVLGLAEIEAYWELGISEHCSVCLDHASEWNPLILTLS